MGPSRAVRHKNRATLKEYKHILGGLNITVKYYDCNHLCTVPYVPMIHKSVMVIAGSKFVFQWGACFSDNEKIRDGVEVERMYHDLLYFLSKFWPQ